MKAKRTEGYGARLAQAGLVLAVHADAFLAAPHAYLTACWWRLKRKRVRSRAQFATLLGASPRAYSLWALRQAQAQAAARPGAGEGVEALHTPPIVALVDIGAGAEGLDATLRSLSDAGIDALTVGPQGLAQATARIDWRSSPWLMPLMAGDRIAAGAGSAYRAALAQAAASALIYADDDLIGRRAAHVAPHFKPDWNSELLRHFDYLTGASILRLKAVDLEAVADAQNWAQALTARAAGQGVPLHLREVLHHRRARPAPVVPAAAATSSRDLPPVSIVVPTRNRVDLLRTCLEGVAATDYPDIEVIVVDNDSDDPETLAYLEGLSAMPGLQAQLLRHAGTFNYSAINNRAVAAANGRLICLLNNDIEMVEPHWLATMAAQALRPDVGAVGARLLYPDGRVQHAGVVIGMGNAAGHAHRFLRPDEEGYFFRHALPQFTSAVTAACLVVQRERFLAVGGLNARDFAVAFNDVDFCLRLNQRGWQSLYEPRATLIHHESVSRGLDRDPVGAARFAGELAALQRLWGTDSITDPFHHPRLSRAAERFTLAL